MTITSFFHWSDLLKDVQGLFFDLVALTVALADKVGDDKGLAEHLKLPIQRINDYQLLLKHHAGCNKL
ncbi:hypothetical protein KGM_203421 [Danaus plexippus plexippus]|uniref:Uncharacterized protein n=1 Tax=Danaus plexippus plexippus TaxID=278856 RepID=A0A212F404_DANPL|nr:hypothetical protein KGM_203421 [Danaus plexippus plexippus]